MTAPTPPADPRLDCPRCAVTMTRIRSGHVSADRCPTCGAVWLEREELERLKKHKDAAAKIDSALPDPVVRKPAPERQVMVCPRDRQQLIRVRDLDQRHIEFDQCKNCGGVFLERGELRDLTEVSLAERLKQLLG